MEIGNFTQEIFNFSQKQVLSADLYGLMSVLYLVLLIAIYSIFIWHFYRFIAQKDCFKIKERKHPKIIGFLKYFFIFPFVAFLFFFGFAIIMLFLTKNLSIEGTLSTSFAVILAIRITAYYSEDLSKDLAKMLPFALLGIFLVDPSYFSFQDVIDKAYSIPEFLTLCIQFIIFIILVEWFLRMAMAVVNHSRAVKQRRDAEKEREGSVY